MAQLPWFERKFNFDFPSGLYPEIFERLHGTPIRLHQSVSSCPVETLVKRDDDRWSIQENAGHLVDLEPLWYGRIDDILSGKEVMREADLTNTSTHEAGHNEKDITIIMKAYYEKRNIMLSKLEELDAEAVAKSSLHPRLNKPMRIVDLAFFVAEHDDFHLARIRELIKLFSSK
jgi:uncharacterized damage-inducible protein DinB